MNSVDFPPPDEPWTAPPEFTASRPRRLKWTGAAIVNLVWAALYLFVVLAFALTTFDTARRAHLLRREGTEVDAVVTRAWTDSTTPMVAYEFSAGGQTTRGEHGIPKRQQPALAAGAHTRVQYVPSDPAINRPVVSIATDSFLPYWVPLLFFAFWVFLAGLAVLPIRKERHLLRYGEPAAGVITNNPQGRVPKYGYVLKYEFQLPDGSTVNGRTQRDLRLHNGALVSVVYDPMKPRRNDMYPTKLFRIRQ